MLLHRSRLGVCRSSPASDTPSGRAKRGGMHVGHDPLRQLRHSGRKSQQSSLKASKDDRQPPPASNPSNQAARNLHVRKPESNLVARSTAGSPDTRPMSFTALDTTVTQQDPIDSGTVTVHFRLYYQTTWGQAVKVIGSHVKLGNWSLSGATDLQWQAGDVWAASVVLPANLGILEYKYVVVDYKTKHPVAWQQGGNSVLAFTPGELSIQVEDNWGNSPGALVKSESGSSTREIKLQGWAREMMSYRNEARSSRMEASQLKGDAGALRSEVLKLRAQLQLAQAQEMSSGMRIAELQQENVRLSSQVMAIQAEMRETLQTAINMMRERAEQDEGEGEDEYMEDQEEGGEGDDVGEGGDYDEDEDLNHGGDIDAEASGNGFVEDEGTGPVHASYSPSSNGNGNHAYGNGATPSNGTSQPTRAPHWSQPQHASEHRPQEWGRDASAGKGGSVPPTTRG